MIDSVAAADRVLFGEDLYCFGRSITEVGGHADTVGPREIVLSYKVLYHPVRGYIKVFDGIEISGDRVPNGDLEMMQKAGAVSIEDSRVHLTDEGTAGAVSPPSSLPPPPFSGLLQQTASAVSDSRVAMMLLVLISVFPFQAMPR
jgi:hypothetical protein